MIPSILSHPFHQVSTFPSAVSSGHPVGIGCSGNIEGHSDEFLLLLSRCFLERGGTSTFVCLGLSQVSRILDCHLLFAW